MVSILNGIPIQLQIFREFSENFTTFLHFSKTVFYYSAFMQFRLRSPPANLIYLKEQAKERVGLIEIVVYT